MDTYSAALLLALVALAISAAGWVISRREERRAEGRRYAIAGAVVAVAFDFLAIGIHWTFGHASGTPSALSPLDFLLAHRITVVIAAGAAVLLWLSRKSG
jgi:hypothetical protein